MAHIIVLGNEKGGSGKSTTAMHVISALLRSDYKVGAIDLDLRQQSLGNYLGNRRAFIEREGIALPEPVFYRLEASGADTLTQAQKDDEEAFGAALTTLDKTCNFILIDCPGAHTRFAQMAHSAADTLITPMNDSLIDLDLLAKMDPGTGKVKEPSIYAQMVWSARQLRASAGLAPLDWVVLRNRLATLDARNRRRVGDALQNLAKRIGFRIVPGFSERVVFRELYLQGLTLLDLGDAGTGKLTMSNIAARQELRELLKSLNLPDTEIRI